MSAIHFTHRALSDLQEIYDRSENEWGEKTAKKYLRHFESAFRIFSENPGLLKVNKKISNRFVVYGVQKH